MPTMWACACACWGLKVPLSPDQLWKKTEQGRPEIFVEVLPLLVLDPKHWFDLKGVDRFSRRCAATLCRRARVGGKETSHSWRPIRVKQTPGHYPGYCLTRCNALWKRRATSLTTSSDAPRIPSAAIRAVCQARHGLEDFAVKFGVPDEV